MSRELIERLAALFSAMDAADDALDKETYDQLFVARGGSEQPDDADVTITYGTHGKINRVFRIVEEIRALRVRTTTEASQ